MCDVADSALKLFAVPTMAAGAVRRRPCFTASQPEPPAWFARLGHMDQPASNHPYVVAFRRRASEFVAKAGQSKSPEDREAWRQLAAMYEDLAERLEELERLQALMTPDS